ncbi:unnamed protein product, partial [Effrenium voratum]
SVPLQILSISLWMEFSLAPCSAPEPRNYVLLVSGTFNPPHRGHVRLGLCAKEQLERLGHSVQAVCWLPVHDNYMLNKQTLAGKCKEGGSELFYPMAQRCEQLRLLLRDQGEGLEAFCHVLDYELRFGAQLLEESPNYWAQRLPEGYLRTVPTKSLLRHFAQHSPLMKSARLGAVFGVDNLIGMASWNAPGELLESTDLVLVAREAATVELRSSPQPLLSELRYFQIQERVDVKYEGKELFGQAVGCFENASASKSAASRLVLLPALGPDEGLSSSCLRKALAECLATCRQHGCASEELLTCLLYHGLRSAAALKREAESADERGERVKRLKV